MKIYIDKALNEFLLNNSKVDDLEVFGTFRSFSDEVYNYLLIKHQDEITNIMKNNKIDRIKLSLNVYNDEKILSMPKSLFYSRMVALYKNKKLNDVENIDKLIQYYSDALNIENYYDDSELTYRVEGKDYTILQKQMLDFIAKDFSKYDLYTKKQFVLKTKEDYINELNAKNQPKIYTRKTKSNSQNNKQLNHVLMPADYFLYCVKQYVLQHKIHEKFLLSKDAVFALADIVENGYRDISWVNLFENEKDDFVDKYEISQDIKDYVYNNMPENYSKLEKAMHVYIKLCKLFTYDPEFYANKQTGSASLEHSRLSRLSELSTTKTNIVCYEFNQVYIKFLKELGIKYSSKSNEDTYGLGHVNVTFVADKFVCCADAVMAILASDMFNAKVNQELNGLTYKGLDEEKPYEFEEKLRNVYNHIKKTEKNPYIDENDSKTWTKFLNSCSAPILISKTQKDKIFNTQVQNCKLPTMDKIAYVLKIAKNIYKKEYLNNQFKAVVVSKTVGERLKSLKPVIMFAYNPLGVNKNGTEYQMYTENDEIVPISSEELKSAFKNRQLKYISNKNSLTFPELTK